MTRGTGTGFFGSFTAVRRLRGRAVVVVGRRCRSPAAAAAAAAMGLLLFRSRRAFPAGPPSAEDPVHGGLEHTRCSPTPALRHLWERADG